LAVGSGLGPRSGIIGRKFSNSKIFDISQEKRQPVWQVQNIPDRNGGTTKDGCL